VDATNASNVVSGTLAVGQGGTGVGTLTSNGVLLGNGASTIQATVAGLANQILRVPGAGGAPAFGSIDVGQAAAVTGVLAGVNGGTGNGFTAFSGPAASLKTFTLPNATATILTSNAAVTVAQGGTGNTTASAGFDALAPTTTRGDLIARGASSNLRLALGLNGQCLTSNGTDPVWGSCAAGSIGGTGTINALPKFTASTTIGNSLLTDDGTTLGYTGTGGISFNPGDGKAGIEYLGQGTAQALGTTAIGLTAPTAVTSYNIVYPGAAATGIPLWSNSASIVTQSILSGSAFQSLRVPNGGGAPAFGSIDVSQSAAVTGIMTAANGGTNNAFTAFSGPASTTKTFTLPNANATVLTDNAAVTIAQGGTGQSTKAAGFDALSPMSALGDVIYGGASGTGTRLAGSISATKQFLSQTGNGAVSAAPAWSLLAAGDIPVLDASKITTGILSSAVGGTGSGFTRFSGPATAEKTFTLPNANAAILTDNSAVTILQGGTGATSALGAFNALSPVTTRGDLIVRGATNNQRLGIGSSGQCLTTDGTDPLWATCPGGAGGGGGGGPNYGTSFTTQTSVTILGSAHNLGTKNLLVECYDTASPANRIEPASYTVDGSTFNVVVNFTASQSGYCAVNGSGPPKYATTFTGQTSVTVTGATHGLNTADLRVTVWDSASGTRHIIEPAEVDVDSTTFNVTVLFASSQSGRIVIQ
jgi:hypothetical protein